MKFGFKTLSKLSRDFPKKFFLGGHCGVLVIQMVLNTLYSGSVRNPLRLYPHDTFWQRLLAWTGSMTIETMRDVFLFCGNMAGEIVDKKDEDKKQKTDFLRRSIDMDTRVVLLINQNGNVLRSHYVSVEGYGKSGTFLIFDPSLTDCDPFGCRIVTGEELMKWWRPSWLFGGKCLALTLKK